MDMFALIIPGADFISDLVMIITIANTCTRSYYWYQGCDVFLSGFWIFIASMFLRSTAEGVSYFLSTRKLGSNEDLSFKNKFLALIMGAIIGPFVLGERWLKLGLAVVDPIISLGYRTGARDAEEHYLLIADHFFWFTLHEQDFIREQSWYAKYFHMVASCTDGSRWLVFVWGKEPHGKESHLHDEESFKFLARIAICEEFLENIGGLMMSISSLLEGGFTVVPIMSLVFTVASALYETGFLVGKVQARVGKANNENEAGEVEEGIEQTGTDNNV